MILWNIATTRYNQPLLYIYNHIYTQNNQTHLLNDTQIPRLASPKQEVIEMTTNKNLKNIFKSTHPNPL